MSDDRSRILTGFNHNISYRGKVYHVQTEDCGIANPVVITHIFLDGMVVDTVKAPYSDIMGDEGKSDEKIMELMKKQHLIVIKRLISGKYANEEDGGGNED